ncbi:MAG: biotin--[acetyl-CoA-carboxylase] ligase [Actinobacteria bacterium]|nr:MAG: biotin--[acetyl-CoA-carboxylase] ligase [Actinomycetota bacterium]
MTLSLAPEFVIPRLRGRFGKPYLYEEVCPSTQRLLGPEHSEGAVAVAEEQTEGRGRLGRQWLSPPRVSVLCSILLEPPVATPQLPELSLIAGEACAEAIAAVTGLEPEIKLPNDLLLGGRKAAGILAESRDGRVVLGTGINVNITEEELPKEVDRPATSLLVESGEPVDRVELLVELLERLEHRYDDWVSRRTTR